MPASLSTLDEIHALAADRSAVALDDDPTGTQTVRDVPVLTRWSAPLVKGILGSGAPVTYLLTNSRSLPAERARETALAIGRLLRDAADAAGTRISAISRSDSTLRGHFPVEVDALAEGLGIPEARVLLAPFFGAGGRVTLGGVHYLRQDGRDVPVADTEFARDPVFGFRSSDLRAWVAERCAPVVRPVATLALSDLRQRGPESVREALEGLPARGILVADAEDEHDIEVVALGALQAEVAGVPLIARTAASYVRARAGQEPAAPLADAEIEPSRPGLVVVGSHVPTTTRQLDILLREPPAAISVAELEVDGLLHGGEPAAVATRLADAADAALRDGRTPVLYTSRALRRGDDAEGDLRIAALVSSTLVDAVRRIRERPSWVLAKGGITSSDVATDGLGVDLATVVGPLLPGVPVWRCGAGSRWPGLTYVVFPGNVGGPEALRDAVGRLVRRT